LKTPETTSDATLMSQLVNGDPLALEALYARHRRSLYSLALRITGDPQGAEEILQDAFFRLWRKSSQFDSTRGSLVGWLLTITRHRAICRIRTQKELPKCESFSDDAVAPPQKVGSSSSLEQHIARELVAVALVGLPEVQQNAITLAYFDGLTGEEIALCTNTPVGTVKSRLRTALKTMQRTLSNPRVSQLPGRSLSPVPLETVVITDQLFSRVCRQRNSQQETDSLHALAQVVAASPEKLIDSFLRMPLDLCRAGTAGLSLLEMNSKGEQVFRWTHLSGRLANHVGGTTPRNFSPCGVTLDCNAPQLFAYPGRYFHYFNDVEVPIVEGLVIPFHVGGKTEGTIWIVSHEERSRFDSEDVRIMSSLGEFAGSALHLMRSLPAQPQVCDERG